MACSVARVGLVRTAGSSFFTQRSIEILRGGGSGILLPIAFRFGGDHHPCAGWSLAEVDGMRVFVAFAAAVTMLFGGRPFTSYAVVNATGELASLEFVGPEPIQVSGLPEHARARWNTALDLAFQNRANFGYPWIDSSERLQLRPVNAAGLSTAREALHDLGGQVDLEEASTSIAQLDAIGDAITRLHEQGVPGAQHIWSTEPDHLNNRIIVTVEAATSPLMDALATTFGNDKVAVRIAPAPAAGPSHREDDHPAFWGGARVSAPQGGCTAGFAWTAATSASMVFAGHCAFNGGNVSYPDFANAGNVLAGAEENWSPTNGTVYFPGENVYRGDLALIRYNSPLKTDGYVYDGAVGNNSTMSPVTAIPANWVAGGDRLCVNGSFGGEKCGVVHKTGTNVHYTANVGGEENVWLRNGIEVDPDNDCPIGGDSGGPVYRRSGDNLTAFGIYSGTGPILLTCRWWFTDIRHAINGLPGAVQFR